MENIAEVINQKTGGNAQTIAEAMAQWNPGEGEGGSGESSPFVKINAELTSASTWDGLSSAQVSLDKSLDEILELVENGTTPFVEFIYKGTYSDFTSHLILWPASTTHPDSGSTQKSVTFTNYDGVSGMVNAFYRLTMDKYDSEKRGYIYKDFMLPYPGTGNNGQVLTITQSGHAIEWADIPE